MQLYKSVKQVSELSQQLEINNELYTILAYNRKNYKIPVSQIKQTKILGAFQSLTKESGKEVPITLSTRDGQPIRLVVTNGPIGDTGDKGKVGPRGDKGDNAPTPEDRSANWLIIVNDCETDDPSKVLSALQGVLMNAEIDAMSETFMTEYQYQLLFSSENHVLIEAEYDIPDPMVVQLINEDNDSHLRFTKYWTYESDGESEYFVAHYLYENGEFQDTFSYDSVYVDLWNDIYFGGKTGFFEATAEQLIDGTPLYIYNHRDDEYTLIEVDEYGNKQFKYWLPEAECYVNVTYTRTGGYDYELDGVELPLDIYIQTVDGYQQITNKADVDTSGLTFYYYYDPIGNEEREPGYVLIEDINAYIARKPIRYYKLSGQIWEEVASLDDINTEEFQEYIVVNYERATNKNTFTRYKHIVTLRDEYYETHVSVINNYSMVYYVEYDEKHPRRYFTRRFVETTDEDGNTTFGYEYIEVTMPFWLEAEFITEEEDQNVLILGANCVNTEGDVDQAPKKYIESIEFAENSSSDNPLKIARDAVKNIDVMIDPVDANVTDMELDYDDTLITLYEDGRIAGIQSDDVTRFTKIKLSSLNNPSINDTLHLCIVTPVKEIVLNTNSIQLYPGKQGVQLEYTTIPEVVSDNTITWKTSDNEMVTITDGFVEAKRNGSEYKLGTCTLTATANDGFGATVTVNVLVATPIERLSLNAKKIGFIGIEDRMDVTVYPDDATEKTLYFWSENPDIIEIDSETGYYTPKQVTNSCKIYCRTTDGTNLEVYDDLSISIGVTNINISGLDDEIEVGLYNDFTITVLPEDAANKAIDISFTDSDIVQISDLALVQDEHLNKYSGRMNAIKGGRTTMTVTAIDGTGTSSEQTIQINIPMGELSFGETSLNLFVGEFVALTPIIGPADTTNQTVTWHSSDTSVATVNAVGRVDAVKSGKVKISAISNDENKVIATCEITVIEPVTEIKFKENSYKVLLNNYAFIEASVLPDNASIQVLKWISSNPEYVTVEDNGTIFGKKLTDGLDEPIMITAVSTDGKGITGEISVEVIKEN